MKTITVLFGVCFSAVTAWAGLVLEPVAIPSGGVAMVRWEGDEPPEQVSLYFQGKPVPVALHAGQLRALVGVDLDTVVGRYEVTAEFADSQGRKQTVTMPLQVQKRERPLERLTLPAQMANPTDPRILKRIDKERKRVAEVYRRRSPELVRDRFVLPVDGEIRSVFGLRRILNGVEKSPHNGVDFRAPTGTPVIAAGGGRVALAEDLYYTGKTVIVDHGGGLFTLYAHLQTHSVRQGVTVSAGDRLGTVGSTGRSTGPHLHFGTRLGTARIDPLALLRLYSGDDRPF